MLKILRIIVLICLLLVWFVVGLVICLARPRHKNNVFMLGRMLNMMCPVFGVKVKSIIPDCSRNLGSVVYAVNHQSNYDIFVTTGCNLPGVVSMGKKSLVWVPFFGILYYLSGNILVDRANRGRAVDSMKQVVAKIKQKGISIWMFPEGTRSKGRGLLPFKTGAFHTALMAKVPVVPIVCSSYVGQIDLNRWDNGEILIEMLPPIDTSHWGRGTVKELTETVRNQMVQKLAELDAQVKRPV
ncbi:1-acylglycerol-3-phosphate O-acyltransferase [Tolumonas lignilytica]|uniref:1-acylglycerol-3-phosphate O-acyltransferase n=1 Tax=Tolumonas lignilytica TaxID=1283284 RepID=UPI0004674598|nr:1-acylglycerol-3-phosphate O-acyltransferase [Tolumonas lignilytica]